MVRYSLIYSSTSTLTLRVGCRSPDGQCLLMSSRDGYCTLAIFDEIIPAHHTQQQSLQLASIAHSHSHSHSHTHSHSMPTPSHQTPGYASTSATPAVTPSPTPARRSMPLPTPAEISNEAPTAGPASSEESRSSSREPPKKKRRVALTHLGDLES